MKNFFDTKDEKITEKAFSQGILISVLSILLCLVALCSITYAWFTGETTSGKTTLMSGTFDLDDIQISKLENGVSKAKTYAPDKVENGVYSYKLSPGTYKIVLVLDDQSTAKGHCIVEIGDVKKHTEAIIGKNTGNQAGYEENAPLEFSITVTEEVVVKFQPVWGVNLEPSIVSNGEYTVDDWNQTAAIKN